jgi:ubiquinone/menaquinone biosynthesis C-methylase UbiE
MRRSDLEPYRRRVLEQATGRVLEIGAGAGANFPFYTPLTADVVAIEPHPRLVAKAARAQVSVPVEMVAASAEELPFEDHSIDTVVMTFTLCSIPDAMRALGEMRRVLKPSGRLLFVEHGLAPDETVRRWQRRLAPLWKRLAGGCHLDRPIAALVEDAGFMLECTSTGYMPGPKVLTFLLEGVARPA